MQRKLALLMGAMTALLFFNQAIAQSSHDAITGSDPDLADAQNRKYEISSRDGDYKIGFRGHLQQNNRFSRNDQGKNDLDIELKRARFTAYGNVLDPALTFLFQLGFEQRHDDSAPENNEKAPGVDYLRDYYVNYACHPRYFQLKAGKFRTPFSRQQLMSTSQMQFYDQHHANSRFQITDTGRDIGLMLHNGWLNPIEWALAVVSNGLVARVGYNYNYIDAYDMVDWNRGDLRFSVAANGYLHTDYVSAGINDVRAGVDFIAKIKGFSTNGAFYYQFRRENEIEHRLGAGLDAGYLINGTYEPVVRYSWIKFPGTRPHEHEVLGGLNYYIYGHHLKLQGYGGVELADANLQKWLAGVQLQLAI